MAKLNYKFLGEGPSLIILHGLYGSSDNWVSIGRELMQHFSVYILDLRNHGDSPHLPDHNYQVMTDDLLEFMNNQNIYSAILLGHSMGGKVAMSFTALHPERVKKLIVVDISPRSYAYNLGDLQKTDHEIILTALANVDLINLKSRKEADAMIAQKIKSTKVRQFLLKNLHRNKDKSFEWKINLDVLQANLASVLVGLEDEREDLNEYKNPALFIKGELSDYILKIDESLIDELFINSTIKTIKGASHWVHAEKPEEFLSLIKEFLM
ncbi:MAG: alpha/beta fold hydrolase [Salinivirgaceae bacterium]|nr:alpha/beta fold hydrolase [Salinivirgaceae bacterium]